MLITYFLKQIKTKMTTSIKAKFNNLDFETRKNNNKRILDTTKNTTHYKLYLICYKNHHTKFQNDLDILTCLN